MAGVSPWKRRRRQWSRWSIVRRIAAAHGASILVNPSPAWGGLRTDVVVPLWPLPPVRTSGVSLASGRLRREAITRICRRAGVTPTAALWVTVQSTRLGAFVDTSHRKHWTALKEPVAVYSSWPGLPDRGCTWKLTPAAWADRMTATSIHRRLESPSSCPLPRTAADSRTTVSDPPP